MKTIIVFALSAFLASCQTSPLKLDGQRYSLFPDGQGVMHLIDLQKKPSSLSKFNPDNDIVFILYTRKNPTSGQVIKKGDSASLSASNFDASKPVKITIHGWTEDATAITNIMLRDAFLKFADVNMITVDWSAGSKVEYVDAVKNVLNAGPSVASLLDWLNTVGAPFSNMHILGHSLGGQMAGIIGRSCTRGKVEIITAMDPALPLWLPGGERIRKTDGKYVELIHTSSGMLGLYDAAGHNDFYPNGGVVMPGCGTDVYCSHSRSVHYMAYSIENKGFMGIECESISQAISGPSKCAGPTKLHLGGVNPKPEIGIFALATNANPPYYQG